MGSRGVVLRGVGPVSIPDARAPRTSNALDRDYVIGGLQAALQMIATGEADDPQLLARRTLQFFADPTKHLKILGGTQ